MGREALLERMKDVVEKEGSARESAKMFTYEVLPSLLDNLPDDFAGFLLNALNNGYIPMDWTLDSYTDSHFLWLMKGNYGMEINWLDCSSRAVHLGLTEQELTERGICPPKPRVTLYLRKCPHIMVEAYYRDANIGNMEKALEEKLKDPQNAQCRAKDEEEKRRREELEHAREESERFWNTVKESADWEVYHISF